MVKIDKTKHHLVFLRHWAELGSVHRTLACPWSAGSVPDAEECDHVPVFKELKL